MRSHNAFTLIELLVVIAIIGVVASLALPAVQSARESSRRTYCSNQIRQLAKGIIQYEAQYRHFPSGGWGRDWLGSARLFGRAQPGGWAFAVLPFVEEQVTYDTVASDHSASAYQALCTATPALFGCPTRRAQGVRPIVANFENYKTKIDDVQLTEAARTDYCVNGGSVIWGGGVNDYAAALPDGLHGETVTICNGAVPSTAVASGLVRNGAYSNDTTLGGCDTAEQAAVAVTPSTFDMGKSWRNHSKEAAARETFATDFGVPAIGNGMAHRMSQVTAGNVLDGLSNVYLVGEKYMNTDKYETGDDPGDTRPMMVGFSSSTIRWAGAPPQSDGADDRPNVFGSAHAGVWNAAFGDGSVRSLSFEIEPETHRNLAARAPRYGTEVLAAF